MKQWFLDRIGKRVYRDADGCTCNTCKDVVENGIVICDREHAEYMEKIEAEFASCGTALNYRDTQ